MYLEAKVCFRRSKGRNKLIFPLLFVPMNTLAGLTSTTRYP